MKSSERLHKKALPKPHLSKVAVISLSVVLNRVYRYWYRPILTSIDWYRYWRYLF